MKFRELDSVVLRCDLPGHGLRKGDLGAVVAVYEPDGLEVEFVRPSGRTQAVVTLKRKNVRRVNDEDVITVRSAAKKKTPTQNGRHSGRLATSG